MVNSVPQPRMEPSQALGHAADIPWGTPDFGAPRERTQDDGRRFSEVNYQAGPRDPAEYRVKVHESNIALVEDGYVSSASPPPAGYEARYQVILPYYGLFAYTAEGKTSLIDSNQILFVSPAEFKDEHPVKGIGHAAVVINPDPQILEALCPAGGVAKAPPFVDVARPMPQRLRLLAHHLRAFGQGDLDDLQRDEWTIGTLKQALGTSSRPYIRASKVVDRAKEVLHGLGFERLGLERIASYVGVNPVYLTQEFTRTQGMPLYRYLKNIRLGRALLELKHCNDITGLALDLGFSSHSHFSAAFKAAFGVTPTDYRSHGARGA